MSRHAGKVLSNWSSSVDMGIVGGEPPSIKDIRGEGNLRTARQVCCLFRDDYDSRWSPAMREILFASILGFYPALVRLLEQHPTSAYTNIKSHSFMRVLLEAPWTWLVLVKMHSTIGVRMLVKGSCRGIAVLYLSVCLRKMGMTD